MMFGCGDSRRSACISLKLLTCRHSCVKAHECCGRATVCGGHVYTSWALTRTWSMLSKRVFMHLMAVKRFVFTLCAFRTSEKVPSPFLATSRYFCIAPAALRANTPLLAAGMLRDSVRSRHLRPAELRTGPQVVPPTDGRWPTQRSPPRPQT